VGGGVVYLFVLVLPELVGQRLVGRVVSSSVLRRGYRDPSYIPIGRL
jgi:hypothetical protein